jgi:hypothetical protein
MSETTEAARPSAIGELRVAAVIVAVLAAAGAVLGVIWQWWSPPGPRAYVIGPGLIQPDETESFIAGDGRFAFLAVLVGVLAALTVWFAALARGVAAVAALAVGGLAGAGLMALVGNLTGGGTSTGKTNTIIDQLPLSVHMHGLLFVEAAAAVLVYGLCASFAAADDLGRPDPEREPALAASGPAPSVGPGDERQDAGADGHGAGALQQGELPPQ